MVGKKVNTYVNLKNTTVSVSYVRELKYIFYNTKLKSKKMKEENLVDQHAIIPGATDTLGWGFDIFGEYNMNAKKRQLLNLEKNGNTYDSNLDFDKP